MREKRRVSSRRAARPTEEEYMPQGRPPKGPELVEGLEGSREAKARLRLALETITGSKSIAQACEELGVTPALVHHLRARALQAALGELEPKPVGRPRKEIEGGGEELEALREENEELRRKLKDAEVKAEIHAAMPYLEERVKEAEKKTEAKQKKR